MDEQNEVLETSTPEETQEQVETQEKEPPPPPAPYQKKLAGQEPDHDAAEKNAQHHRIQDQLKRAPVVLLSTLVFAIIISSAWGYLGPKSVFHFGNTDTESNKQPAPGHANSILASAPNQVSIAPDQASSSLTENPVVPGNQTQNTASAAATNNQPNIASTDYQEQMRLQLDMQRQQVQAQREQEAYQREQDRQAQMKKILEAPSTVYSAMDHRNTQPMGDGNNIQPAFNMEGVPGLIQGRIQTSNASSYLPHTRMPALSPYEIKAGTVIPSVMLSGINSDLPGEIIAQVVQNVYDSATGKYLLIPQGARLVGNYDHNLVLGQQRVLIAWSRIIYPDSSSVEIQGMAGQDQSGYAGFQDQTNHHIWPAVRQALLLSAISAGAQLSQPRTQRGDYSYSSPQIGAAALGQQLNQLGMYSYQSQASRMPTITIRPGYRFNVMVNKDMVLAPWQGETAYQSPSVFKTALSPE